MYFVSIHERHGKIVLLICPKIPQAILLEIGMSSRTVIVQRCGVHWTDDTEKENHIWMCRWFTSQKSVHSERRPSLSRNNHNRNCSSRMVRLYSSINCHGNTSESTESVRNCFSNAFWWLSYCFKLVLTRKTLALLLYSRSDNRTQRRNVFLWRVAS